MLPDRTKIVGKGQKIENKKWDILGDFQTIWKLCLLYCKSIKRDVVNGATFWIITLFS